MKGDVDMKKIFIVLLCIITSIVFSYNTYAEGSGNLIYATRCTNDEYSYRYNAYISGFDETTDSSSVAIGTLNDPSEELVNATERYIEDGDTAAYIRIGMYDSNSDDFVETDDVPRLNIKIKRPNSAGGGQGSVMGKNYRVLYVENGKATLLEITKSNKYEVCFNADKLGYFVLIYNPNALNFTFISDGEIYSQMKNVSTKDEIIIPEPPSREGYAFDGWYYYGANPDITLRLTEGTTLAEVGTETAYARWIEQEETDNKKEAATVSLLNLNKLMSIIKREEYGAADSALDINKDGIFDAKDIFSLLIQFAK